MAPVSWPIALKVMERRAPRKEAPDGTKAALVEDVPQKTRPGQIHHNNQAGGPKKS